MDADRMTTVSQNCRDRRRCACADGARHMAKEWVRSMQVRSIIFFEAKEGQEERFKANFGALRDAVGFPGFLGGEFSRSVQNPRIFTVTALWENREAYAAWQARGASLTGAPAATVEFLKETLIEVPSGKPYDIVYQVGAK